MEEYDVQYAPLAIEDLRNIYGLCGILFCQFGITFRDRLSHLLRRQEHTGCRAVRQLNETLILSGAHGGADYFVALHQKPATFRRIVNKKKLDRKNDVW